MLKVWGLATLLLSTVAFADNFPRTPDAQVTPGSLCERPDTYRYPEKVPYCDRSVEPSLKHEIFVEYDQKFGYRTTQMNRMDFKIDHHIPLCMGGSNEEDNLWPQHKSVYVLTDKAEELLCRLMASGRMKQADAVQTIRDLKQHPETGPGLIERLERQVD